MITILIVVMWIIFVAMLYKFVRQLDVFELAVKRGSDRKLIIEGVWLVTWGLLYLSAVVVLMAPLKGVE